MADRWYVAQTKPSCEFLAQRELKQQGFAVFLPLIEVDRFRGRVGEEPRFRGYIFVALDREDDPWEKVNYTRGVRELLFKETPLPLPLGFVEALTHVEKRVPEIDLFVRTMRPGVTTLRVIEGPFESYLGRFQGVEDANVQVLLNLLGRDVMVRLAPHQVERA